MRELLFLVPILSLWFGWWIYNPLSRNQPRSRSVGTAIKLVALDSAVRNFFSARQRFPDSLYELKKNRLH